MDGRTFAPNQNVIKTGQTEDLQMIGQLVQTRLTAHSVATLIAPKRSGRCEKLP
jgi:hypothetical protein